jgi:hypothetical protein
MQIAVLKEQVAEQARSIWSIWFVWLTELVWFNQISKINQTNRLNETDQRNQMNKIRRDTGSENDRIRRGDSDWTVRGRDLQ